MARVVWHRPLLGHGIRKLVHVTATAQPAVDVSMVAGLLVERMELRRLAAWGALDPKKRAALGQYFTPVQVADFIASLARFPEGETIRILDPGAGAGSLSASISARVIRERPDLTVTLVACELDEALHPVLSETLKDCRETAGSVGVKVSAILQAGSFIDWAAGGSLLEDSPEPFDLVVMNPPYKKLGRSSHDRRVVETHACEVSNLYAAFLALAVNLLRPDGHLVAITPRSFANGPYFRGFRGFFLDRMHLDWIHVCP